MKLLTNAVLRSARQIWTVLRNLVW